jgi:hypothetical protein
VIGTFTWFVQRIVLGNLGLDTIVVVEHAFTCILRYWMSGGSFAQHARRFAVQVLLAYALAFKIEQEGH